MDDRLLNDPLLEKIGDRLQRRVEELFEHAPPDPSGWEGWSETPVIGGQFVKRWGYSSLVSMVCDAVLAREKFRIEREAAGWPRLPLRHQEFDQMTSSDDNRKRLVGFFGASMRESEWDPTVHPSFTDYCRGLLAYDYTPYRLRSDPELRRKFPPRPLEGLCDGWMHWRSPKTRAEHRRVRFKPPVRTKPGAHLTLIR